MLASFLPFIFDSGKLLCALEFDHHRAAESAGNAYTEVVKVHSSHFFSVLVVLNILQHRLSSMGGKPSIGRIQPREFMYF